MEDGAARAKKVSSERTDRAQEMLDRMAERGLFSEPHEAAWLERQKAAGVKAIDILEAFMQGGVRPLEHGAQKDS